MELQPFSDIILVKLGGSVITDKDNLKAANIPKIEQLADEIHRSRRDDSRVLVVGHGAGSFGHPPASRYRTIEGLEGVEGTLVKFSSM